MLATGLCIYLLVREFEISQLLAVFAGVIGQMMPWLRQNILYAPAGSWDTVGPLIIILLLTRFRKNLTIGNASKVFGGLLFCATLSGYAFFFSIFIVLFASVFELHHIYRWFQTLAPRQRVFAFVSGSLLALSIVFFILFLLNHTRNEFGVPYGIYKKQTVLANAGTLNGFVTPDHFHLLFPRKDTYTVVGDQQNYAGLLLVFFALLGLTQIGWQKNLVQFKVLIVSTLGFLLLALGRFRIGPVDVPSLREYARYIMPGVRHFIRTGLILEHLLIVLAFIFLSARLVKISSNKFRIAVLLFVTLFIALDLNPSSRRVIWDYSNRFEEVRQKLSESAENGLFVPNGVATYPSIGAEGLADVFGAPLYTDLLGVYPYAARGSSELAKYLDGLNVEFVFARIEESTNKPYMTGFIQDSARFTTYFNESDFYPVSQVVIMESRDDTGRVLESWLGRLLRVKGSNTNNSRPEELRLAQMISSPNLEVRNSQQNRFLSEADWSVTKQITLTPEALGEYLQNTSKDVTFRIHLKLLSPLALQSATPFAFLVKADTSIVRYEITDFSKMIQIDVPKGGSAIIELLTDCKRTSSANDYWGLLSERDVCFGIGEFWVEALAKAQ